MLKTVKNFEKKCFFKKKYIEFTTKWVYLIPELLNQKERVQTMTIKCEKCGADVVLPDDAKTATCEKCGAEVTVKAEEKAEESVEEKEKTV